MTFPARDAARRHAGPPDEAVEHRVPRSDPKRRPGRSPGSLAAVTLDFQGPVIYWRGPAPFYFVRVPERESAEIRAVSREVTYGWGCIPARATLGPAEWDTALFPKDGIYLVPIRAATRKSLGLEEGHVVSVYLAIGGA